MPTTSERSAAIIPARGGSKRIPRKNVREFDGRPLITWVIDTCLASGAFDDVVVTTDDPEVADISRAAGAEVPFLRPASLADDAAPIVPAVAHALAALADMGTRPGTACLVYPTAVTLLAEDLAASRPLLPDDRDDTYVVGIVQYHHPIQRALHVDDDGRLTMVDPTTQLTRTQDLPPRWHDAGQFVWGHTATWLREIPVLMNSVGFELPAWRAVDLDTPDDWMRAELIHRLLRT